VVDETGTGKLDINKDGVMAGASLQCRVRVVLDNKSTGLSVGNLGRAV
jgi:hypothetical protein